MDDRVHDPDDGGYASIDGKLGRRASFVEGDEGNRPGPELNYTNVIVSHNYFKTSRIREGVGVGMGRQRKIDRTYVHMAALSTRTMSTDYIVDRHHCG
jgi:hypothetical protein